MGNHRLNGDTNRPGGGSRKKLPHRPPVLCSNLPNDHGHFDEVYLEFQTKFRENRTVGQFGLEFKSAFSLESSRFSLERNSYIDLSVSHSPTHSFIKEYELWYIADLLIFFCLYVGYLSFCPSPSFFICLLLHFYRQLFLVT